MKRNEIMNAIKSLGHSQGFYGSMYAHLVSQQENDPEGYDSVMKTLEAANFKDAVDMVLYFES